MSIHATDAVIVDVEPDEQVSEPEPIVSFVIPCYNSAAYMDHCVLSILEGSHNADDIEIIIVDDGSKDETLAKGQTWAAGHPQIRVVHQENGGHGSAVCAGLKIARGNYFKVVDSDDWLDADALQELLILLRTHINEGKAADLYISNYVYEHVDDGTSHAVGYGHALPARRFFTWSEIGHFRSDQNLLMHSLLYRTSVLREGNGLPLPPHTFYVDNIYAYVPLPRCQTMYYLDVDLYRYYIGRSDQSVNETVMISRYDHQLRITSVMMHAYHLNTDVQDSHLRAYMLKYFTLMMAISSLFGHMSENPSSDDDVTALWQELKDYDEAMYHAAHSNLLGIFTNLPGRWGKKTTAALYRIARKVVKFN